MGMFNLVDDCWQALAMTSSPEVRIDRLVPGAEILSLTGDRLRDKDLGRLPALD